jgi:hypothetical protein
LSFVAGLAFLLTGAAEAAHAQGSLQIREFVASNSGGLLDEDQDSSDWIEIRNAAATPINLFNWRLTDDAGNLVKWTFPAKVLNPGEYLIVFASGKNRVNPNAPLHTSFSLSAQGEFLALVMPSGTVATQFAPSYPAQEVNVSYGLTEGTDTAAYFTPPTPGAPNGPPYLLVPDVHFSHERGFHDAPFALTLTNSEAGASIRYTLDGTAPSETNGLTYTAPIAVNRGTMVRAIAVLPGTNHVSSSVTSTYLFPAEVLNQSDVFALNKGFPSQWIEKDGTNWTLGGAHPGASYGFDPAILADYSTQELLTALKSIPSVSLVMPMGDWFGHQPPAGPFGIYVNSEESTDDWDKAVSAEWIDPSGGPEFQINCGVGIQGGSSTSPAFRGQLSMTLKFKSDFGPDLEFPVFPGGGVQTFDRLILDAGNQDSLYRYASPDFKSHMQHLRDAYLTELQRVFGGAGARGRYVHLFLNGLYWGLYWLHERPDDDWGAATFGGDSDEYDWVKVGGIMKGNSNPYNSPYGPGAWPTAMAITAFGLTPSSTFNGQNSYELLQKYVDLPAYCDYLLVNYYGGNTDWPHHNWYATSRARLGPNLTDVNPEPKFLFHEWDGEESLYWHDFSVYAVADGYYDRTTILGQWPGDAAFIRGRADGHPDFRILVADRAHRLLFNDGPLYVKPGFNVKGTVYDPAHPERNRPASLYHDMAAAVDKAMILGHARWVNYWFPGGTFKVGQWNAERDRLLNDYFPVRSAVLLAQLRNTGLYPSLDAPSFSHNGGLVNHGTPLVITGPANSTIYITLDGTDPRQAGGAVHPGAVPYGAPIPLVHSAIVKARAHQNGVWSALNEATFTVDLQLRITEILADNLSSITDEAGDHDDWVELYNGGSLPVSLTGMYLSDNPSNPKKFKFTSAATVPPGGHVVIWCDEELGEGPYHANIKLSKSGESVILTHTDAAGNLTLDSVDFGPQLTDVTWARIPEAGPFLSLFPPTPGAANTPAPGSWIHYDSPNASSTTTQLTLGGSPQLGQTLTFTVSNAGPSSPGLVFFGADPSCFTIPFEGDILMAFVFDGTSAPYVTTAGGVGSTSIGVPPSPHLLGILLTAQSYTFSGKFSNAAAFVLAP